LVAASIMQPFEMPSTSMENTLLPGDHFFVSRWPTEIRRGDVVAFRSPEEDRLFVVKRVVAIPGDKLHLRDGVLYLNDVRQDEPYVRHKLSDFNPYRDNFPAMPASESNGVSDQRWARSIPQYVQGDDLILPPNSYFGMGDSRDISYDSRYYGFFPRENVVGKLTFIYWSFNTPPEAYERSLEDRDRLAFVAHIIIHFFDETRWSRTFKVVK